MALSTPWGEGDSLPLRHRLESALRRFGDYTLGEKLRGAGMSHLFVAEDARLNRRVVVKCVDLTVESGTHIEDPGALFEAEMRITARLQHPNIVKVHFCGEGKHLYFYTMEFVPGESLRDRLAARKALPLPEALTITRQVASALQAVHEGKVVHCDIKPGNILLQGRRALIADFGIARALDERTRSAQPLGTLPYASPEQRAGHPFDHRTDIFALGCVLHEMLTGQPPAGAQARLDRALLPGVVSPFIAEAIGKAIAPDPTQRFASVQEFGRALQPFAAGAVVAVTPFLTFGGSHQWLRGHELAEVVRGRLAGDKDLRVMGRGATPGAEAGESIGDKTRWAELGVDLVVGGSVHVDGKATRVLAHLEAVLSGLQVWSASFPCSRRAWSAIQQRVAEAIAAAVHERGAAGAGATGGATRTRGAVRARGRQLRSRARLRCDDETLESYLRARESAAALNGEALARADELLLDALERTPDFAPALALRARVAAWAGSGLLDYPEPARLHEALALAERTLALQPDVPDAFFARGLARALGPGSGDWVADFDACLALDCSWAEAFAMRGLLRACLEKDIAAGLTDLDRATWLDPLSVRWRLMRGLVLRLGGELDRARDDFAALAAAEQPPGAAHAGLMLTLVRLGETGAARDHALALHATHDVRWLGDVSYVLGVTGDHARAHRVIAQLAQTDEQRRSCACALALAHAGVGDDDGAVRWLRLAAERGEGSLAWTKTAPELAALKERRTKD